MKLNNVFLIFFLCVISSHVLSMQKEKDYKNDIALIIMDDGQEGPDEETIQILRAIQSDNPNMARLRRALQTNDPEQIEKAGRAVPFMSLHSHAVTGNVRSIKSLVEEYHFDVNTRDKNGNTALHVAVAHSQIAVINLLIKYDALIDAQNNKGLTPLHLATSKGILSIVKTLIKHKAEVNIQTRSGLTPLHCARSGDVNLLEVLVKAGAFVDAQDERGATPLHFAALRGHDDAINVLVKRCGATIDARTKTGNTPLHTALSQGHQGAAEALIACGANQNAKNSAGKIPGGHLDE